MIYFGVQGVIHMEEILSRLSEQLDEIIQKRVDIYTRTVYYRIINDFHTKCKRKLSDDNDSSYDSSGHTNISFNDHFFDVTDYETIGDFLEELNGNTIRSFASGGSLIHQTFGEYYQDDLEEDLHRTMQGFLYSIDDNDFKVLTNEIYDHIPEGLNRWTIIADIGCYFNEFECSIYQKAEEAIDIIEQASFIFWHKKLSKQVLCDIEKEKERQRKQLAELQLFDRKERQKFKQFWSRLEKRYMLMYQKNLPKQVNMDGYYEFRRFLKQNDVTYEEVMTIIDYSSIQFSEEVVYLLEDDR